MRLPKPRGVLWRRRDALKIVVPLHLFHRAAGNKQRREHLAKCGIVLPPPLAYQREHGIGIPNFLFRSAMSSAARKTAIQHKVADSLRMTHGIGHRDRRALRDAEKREAVHFRRIDDRLEVAHPGLE